MAESKSKQPREEKPAEPSAAPIATPEGKLASPDGTPVAQTTTTTPATPDAKKEGDTVTLKGDGDRLGLRTGEPAPAEDEQQKMQGDSMKLSIFACEALRALIIPGGDAKAAAGRAIEFADAMLAAEPEDFPVSLMGAAAIALGRLASPSGDPARVADEAWSFASALAHHED